MSAEPVFSKTRIAGIAPQFLVDNLNTALQYYSDKLGFTVDFVYESFYASVSRDGCAIHLKCAPKTISDRVHRKENEHLDVLISVTGIDALFEEFKSRDVVIGKEIEERPWAARDFYVEDPDGYILCFSEPTT